MKFDQILLAFMCLLITFCTAVRVMHNTVIELERVLRQPCTCKTSTGRCMNIGDRQCWFVKQEGASIVECNNNGDWQMVVKCEHTCQTLKDDHPHCMAPVEQHASGVGMVGLPF